MSFEISILWAMFFLATFLLGYAIGRRVGRKEGFLEGMNTSPIELRQQLLRNSSCPLCQQTLNGFSIYDNIHREY